MIIFCAYFQFKLVFNNNDISKQIFFFLNNTSLFFNVCVDKSKFKYILKGILSKQKFSLFDINIILVF